MKSPIIPQGAKRAILYARVSGDDRRNATSSIDGQLGECRRYAEQKGYQVVEEIFEEPDKHTSGADWLPELEKVVGQAAAGNYDVLVVREMDRLARDRLKQLLVENDLKHKGVHIEYVIGQYEDTPEGDLQKGIVADVAEYQRKKIAQNTLRGRLRSVDAGNVTTGGSGAPIGYDLAIVNDQRTLVISESEAPIVRLIFDLYTVHGYNRYEIRDELDRLGIPIPQKGVNHQHKRQRPNWSLATVRNILMCETYIGQWHYNKTTKTKNPKTGKASHRPRPRDEWRLITVPAIISEEQFAIAQGRKTTNKRIRAQQRRHHYLLGGMLVCGHCGKGMSGVSRDKEDKTYSYYVCNARNSPKFYGYRCENVRYRDVKINTEVWAIVKRWILDPAEREQGLADLEQAERNKLDAEFSMEKNNRAELADLEKQLKRYADGHAAGAYDLDQLLTYAAPLNEKIRKLRLAIGTIPTEVAHRESSAKRRKDVEMLANVVSDAVEMADNDPALQRKIFQTLGVQVELRYEGDCRTGILRFLSREQRFAQKDNTTCGTNLYCTFATSFVLS